MKTYRFCVTVHRQHAVLHLPDAFDELGKDFKEYLPSFAEWEELGPDVEHGYPTQALTAEFVTGFLPQAFNKASVTRRLADVFVSLNLITAKYEDEFWGNYKWKFGSSRPVSDSVATRFERQPLV